MCYVLDCASFTQGAMMLEPKVENDGPYPSTHLSEHAVIGSSLHFRCLAYLGNGDKFMGWQRYMKNKKQPKNYNQNASERIYFETSSR